MIWRFILIIILFTACDTGKRVISIEKRLDDLNGADNPLKSIDFIRYKLVNYCWLDSNELILRIELTNTSEQGVYLYDPPIRLEDEYDPNPNLHYSSRYSPIDYFTYLGSKKTKRFLIVKNLESVNSSHTLYVCLDNDSGIYDESFENISWKLDRYIFLDSLMVNNYDLVK